MSDNEQPVEYPREKPGNCPRCGKDVMFHRYGSHEPGPTPHVGDYEYKMNAHPCPRLLDNEKAMTEKELVSLETYLSGDDAQEGDHGTGTVLSLLATVRKLQSPREHQVNVEVSDEDFKPENVRRASMVSEEFQAAIDAWRGELTEEQRSVVYERMVDQPRPGVARAIRVLKAAAR